MNSILTKASTFCKGLYTCSILTTLYEVMKMDEICKYASDTFQKDITDPIDKGILKQIYLSENIVNFEVYIQNVSGAAKYRANYDGNGTVNYIYKMDKYKAFLVIMVKL